MICCLSTDTSIHGDGDGQDIRGDHLLVGHGHPYPRNKKWLFWKSRPRYWKANWTVSKRD